MQRRIKLLVIDIAERMNVWEELAIHTDEDGVALYVGSSDDVPASLLNREVTSISQTDEAVLLYITQ